MECSRIKNEENLIEVARFLSPIYIHNWRKHKNIKFDFWKWMTFPRFWGFLTMLRPNILVSNRQTHQSQVSRKRLQFSNRASENIPSISSKESIDNKRQGWVTITKVLILKSPNSNEAQLHPTQQNLLWWQIEWNTLIFVARNCIKKVGIWMNEKQTRRNIVSSHKKVSSSWDLWSLEDLVLEKYMRCNSRI